MKRTDSVDRRPEHAVTRFLLAVLSVALSGAAMSDSSRVPTRAVQPIPIGANPIFLGIMGNLVYFTAQPKNSPTPGGAALFKTDGTTAGTTQVAPIDGIGVLTSSTVGTLLISAGTKSYFLANTTAAGQEVWVTDGTGAGTYQVADLYPGGAGLSPSLLGLIGTDLIFAESISDNTMQLFRTDGTAGGTQPSIHFRLIAVWNVDRECGCQWEIL